MRRGRRARGASPAELNITAFMNLMVILVPFLLITAVFSRITVLDLSLPGAASKAAPPQGLELEIILRNDTLEVSDRGTGPIRIIQRKSGRYDLATLGRTLQEIKARYPQKTSATILAQADVPYDALVQVMDTVRVTEVAGGAAFVQTELFPDISIGDAPPAANRRRR